MPVNMSTVVYLPCQELFGRPVTFMLASGVFAGRGIYDSRILNVPLEDGSILTDQDTILDIRTFEFPVLPAQGDTLSIPYEPLSGLPAMGDFEITDVWHNGGGEVTLQLKAIGSKAPP